MKNLKNERCCFTCKNNRNRMLKDYLCDCEFKNREEYIAQDMWCYDYENPED